MIPIILDTDIGTDVDDALALTLAAHSPELEILTVTTVNGNAVHRARIARKLLTLLGREDIPVAAGYDTTIDGKPCKWHGYEGRGFIESEQDGLPIHDRHAEDVIIETLKASAEKVTMLMVGPVTNLAGALKKDPSIKTNIARVVIMGGSVFPRDILRAEGWIHFPGFFKAKLEYNLNADPAAAAMVLSAGIPLVLVPAEITFKTWLTHLERGRLKQSALNHAAVLNRMCDDWVKILELTMEKLHVSREIARVYLHDPLTIAVTYTREFVTTQPFHLVPGKRFGIFRTLPVRNKPANAEVVTGINVPAFKKHFAQRVFGIDFDSQDAAD